MRLRVVVLALVLVAAGGGVVAEVMIEEPARVATRTVTVTERAAESVTAPATESAVAADSDRRPAMGVELAEAVPAMTQAVGLSRCAAQANKAGLFVTAVVAGSGADAAGLQPATFHVGRVALGGDLIVRLGGRPVRTTAQLLDMLATFEVGDVVVLDVLSCDGERREVDVELGESDYAR